MVLEGVECGEDVFHEGNNCKQQALQRKSATEVTEVPKIMFFA